MSLARVDELITMKMSFQLLDNLNAKLKVVGGMSIDELTDLLSLIWAFFDDLAVILKKVPHEEFVEVSSSGVLITALVNFDGEHLAEDKRIGKCILYGRESTKDHGEEGVESS